jgi:hypothetical protein
LKAGLKESKIQLSRFREIIIPYAWSHPLVLEDRLMSVQLGSSKCSELIMRQEVAVPGRNRSRA